MVTEPPTLQVLHLAPGLGDRGGADLYLRSLIACLRDSLVQTLVIDKAAPTPEASGMPNLRQLTLTGLAESDGSRFDRRSFDELLHSANPDLLHLHNVMSPSVLNWAADRGAICTVQDHRCFCPGPGKWIVKQGPCRQAMSAQSCRVCLTDRAYRERMLDRTGSRLKALSRMHAVTVLSDYMKRELVDAGLAAHRIRVIRPAVFDIQHDAVPATPRAILFVGRLVRAKGVDDAVCAWRRSGVDLPLRFVGTGPMRGELERQGFEVSGWLNRSQLSAQYAGAAALLLPSRWQEPFGIVGLEALSFAVPVVAWRSGGVEEWHPGGASLVDWGDVDALAMALRSSVSQPAERPVGYKLLDLAAAHQHLYAELRSPTREHARR